MSNAKYSLEHAALNLLYFSGEGASQEHMTVEEAREHLLEAAREERVFVAVGEGYWGRGRDKEAALDAMVRAGGRRKGKWILYSCPPGTYLSGNGALTYPNVVWDLGIDRPEEVERYDPGARRARKS